MVSMLIRESSTIDCTGKLENLDSLIVLGRLCVLTAAVVVAEVVRIGPFAGDGCTKEVVF